MASAMEKNYPEMQSLTTCSISAELYSCKFECIFATEKNILSSFKRHAPLVESLLVLSRNIGINKLLNENLTAMAMGKLLHTSYASDPDFIRLKCFILNPGYTGTSTTKK